MERDMLSESGELTERLNRLARMVGRVFGVEIGVDESGDRLVFVDDIDEPLTNDGQEIIAVTPDEIQNKDIGEFSVRALRAAGIAKYQQIERERTP
jgi:hypothetical protein